MYKTKKFKNRNFKKEGFNKRSRSRGAGKAPKKIDIHHYIDQSKNTVPEAPHVLEHRFEDFNLNPELNIRLNQKGYQKPTEIQDKAIPMIMKGHDVIGIAGTGTGKTAAFLLPVINRLMENQTDQYALVVTPTRELANQIADEFKSFTKGLGLFYTSLIGGNRVDASLKSLSRKNHIIIGTPGRLIDMVKRGALKLENFKVLILDEFDRMLDMGFLEDVAFLEQKMKSKEQTLLFSATMEASQQAQVTKMTNDPVMVKAGKGTQNTGAIAQEVIKVPSGQKKIDFLKHIINQEDQQKIILFCETKRKVDLIHKTLNQASITTDMIHGDKTQKAREVALRKFKNGKIQVLVATDVVARGIDITDIALVINYEVPRNYNDYVHRIGRTGRAGKSGRAITFLD